MRDPRDYHFKLPPYEGPRLEPPAARWYPGIEAAWPHSTEPRTLRSDGRIRAFVIHATVLPNSAKCVERIFKREVSFHWLIPGKDEPEHGRFIWICAPEDRAAWHVRSDCSHPEVNGGRRHVNHWSLGVEIVNTQRQDDPFSDWQVEQAAALVRYAWSKYPDLVDVVSHAKLDPERRTDPGPLFPWEKFQKMVLGNHTR